jgi:hypothetical protein
MKIATEDVQKAFYVFQLLKVWLGAILYKAPGGVWRLKILCSFNINQ